MSRKPFKILTFEYDAFMLSLNRLEEQYFSNVHPLLERWFDKYARFGARVVELNSDEFGWLAKGSFPTTDRVEIRSVSSGIEAVETLWFAKGLLSGCLILSSVSELSSHFADSRITRHVLWCSYRHSFGRNAGPSFTFSNTIRLICRLYRNRVWLQYFTTSQQRLHIKSMTS